MNHRIVITLAAAIAIAAPAARANWISNPGSPINIITSGDDDPRERDRDRADEKADKDQAKADKEEELYDRGTDALDDHNWRSASLAFQRVAQMHMAHADAALYWLAYAQSKMGMRSEALSTLLDLQKSHPHSKWVEDGKALEVEIRQSAGQTIQPEHVADEDLKLMAINGLMNSDSDRAIPILENIINGNYSSKLKERALFVLGQSQSPKAQDLLVRIAKGGPPDLRAHAVRTLGIMGGERSRATLSDIYNGTNDVETKKSVLKAYMISGDRARLLALAKGEQNADLRADAVMQLGVMGARNELVELYSSESSIEVKKKIIQAMFIGGNAEKLSDLARNEKVLELKVAAIRNLGLLGGSRTGQLLLSLYEGDTRREVRRAVVESLFVQNNARTLVDLARKEKDPDMKRDIVEKLSIMRSKEATDYLMEYLKE